MPQPKRDLAIPPPLLASYMAGELTINELAERVGAAREVVNRTLRGIGIDTSMAATKRRRHRHRWAQSTGIPASEADALAVRLYGQGRSLREVAAAVGCNKRAAREILERANAEARPTWTREVFRDDAGGLLDLAPFAGRLRSLRESLGLSQQRLAARCDLSQGTVWHLERGLKGPTWATLYKLTSGIGVGREALGVEADWPGPVPPGLLGPRRRATILALAAPTTPSPAPPAPTPADLAAPVPSPLTLSYDTYGGKAGRWGAGICGFGLGFVPNMTYDAERFRPPPHGGEAHRPLVDYAAAPTGD